MTEAARLKAAVASICGVSPSREAISKSRIILDAMSIIDVAHDIWLVDPLWSVGRAIRLSFVINRS